MESLLISVGILGYILLTIYLANYEQLHWYENKNGTRALLFIASGSLGLMALAVLLTALNQSTPVVTDATMTTNDAISLNADVSSSNLLLGFFIASILGTICIIILISDSLRQRLQTVINGTYSAYSKVHTTAIIFSLAFVGINTVSFLLQGGTEGMAQSIDAEGVSSFAIILQAVLFVIAAVLGVGFKIRRQIPQTLQRLGITIPTIKDVLWSIVTVVGAFVALSIYGGILTVFISPEDLAEQTQAAESVVNAFSTIPLALLMASSAAIGEEVFFRGALQPVFGLIPTTIFFAAIHTQVLLTPSIVSIFIVGLAFGLLRQRFNTTAAIIAHFIYNFLIVLINILVTSSGAI